MHVIDGERLPLGYHPADECSVGWCGQEPHSSPVIVTVPPFPDEHGPRNRWCRCIPDYIHRHLTDPSCPLDDISEAMTAWGVPCESDGGS